ncbi:MAG: hypothetical protein C0501_19515 [Isosphaera sp.]|nr:hypothetical protein [Isosphaera sp.]
MRQLALAAGAACALAGLAAAQGPAMPGQVVGSGYAVNPVGGAVPKAAPTAGRPVNLPAESAMLRRQDPSRPLDALRGSSLDPSQVVAPVPGAGDQNLLSKLYDKLRGVVSPRMTEPNEPGRSTYFPSLSRRNRERAEERMWRRD